jgi:hypothetical protein
LVTSDREVPALIALSLLEAIRNLDTPVEDGLEELSPDIVSKRLGLSSTVAAQIDRYRQAVERDATLPREEAMQVLRLVGRRLDHELVFADAGRRAARRAARSSGASTRTLLKVSPDLISRRVGRRAAARVAREIFEAQLDFTVASAGAPGAPAGPMPQAEIGLPLTVEALDDGNGCIFYAAAFAEVLRTLTGFEGAMVHERCRGRGDTACAWRGIPAEGYD